jgi:histone deacetylase 1/2
LVYVDGLIITGNNSTKLDTIIQSLGHQFNLKDLGNLHYFLCVEVIPTNTGLFLSQHNYIYDLLSRYKLNGAKPTHTPLSTSETLQLHGGFAATNSTIFKSVIGALQYLSLTRPDISLSINHLAQFMHKLTHSYWFVVMRLLRYLKGTLYHGLHLRSSSSISCTAYSDADVDDRAGNVDDRTSTSSYIVFLGSNPIS